MNRATPIAGGGPDGSDHLSFDGINDLVEFKRKLTENTFGNANRSVCLWAKFDKDDFDPEKGPGPLFSCGLRETHDASSTRVEERAAGEVVRSRSVAALSG